MLNKVFFIGISYKEHAQWSLTWMCLPSHLVEDFSWCTIIIRPWLIHESLLPTHAEWERLWNNVEFIWSHMQPFLFEFPAWIPSFVMSTRTQKSMLHMLFGLNSSKNTNQIPITICLSSDTLYWRNWFLCHSEIQKLKRSGIWRDVVGGQIEGESKNWRAVKSEGMLLVAKLEEKGGEKKEKKRREKLK